MLKVYDANGNIIKQIPAIDYDAIVGVANTCLDGGSAIITDATLILDLGGA